MMIFTFIYFVLSLFVISPIILTNIYEQRRLKHQPVNIILLFPAYIGIFCIQWLALTQIIEGNSLDVTTFIQWACLSLSISCLTPPIRRLLALLLPVDAKNHVHAFTLALSPLIFILLFNQPDLKMGLKKVIDDFDPSSFLFETWSELILTVVICFAGVGLFIKRNWKETCHRLGLVKPQWRQFGLGVLFAVGLLVWDFLFDLLTTTTTDHAAENLLKTYHQLIGQNIWFILTIGLTAGIGEELICRGLLLPRLGIIYSSLLFAGLHLQYGVSMATISVFTTGIILALIRKHYNTNTAIITHAILDIIILFIYHSSS